MSPVRPVGQRNVNCVFRIRSFFRGKYYPMQYDKAHATNEVFRCTTETF
jgi:hypothetical protein